MEGPALEKSLSPFLFLPFSPLFLLRLLFSSLSHFLYYPFNTEHDFSPVANITFIKAKEESPRVKQNLLV